MDKELSDLLLKIKAAAIESKFTEVATFKIKDAQVRIEWILLENPGIYLIEIKNSRGHTDFKEWFKEFEKLWTDKKYQGWYTPSIKKKRVIAHETVSEWIPIYIGKSKKISTRIKSHLNKKRIQKTFALKLLERTNLYQETFRLSKIDLSLINYDTIAPIYEIEKRNLINPIIGKQ
ncbi:MAG: hypothetical protein ABJF27_15570 [Crocinitomicaceae bacterium]